MRIHQITDLHVPEENAGQEFDHVKGNILKQLSYIKSDSSDLLVISGDLTMTDASIAACEWIESVLPASLNTIVMPGNHDDPKVIWEVFGPARCIKRSFYFTLQREQWNIVFLDTSTDTLPASQLEFLATLPEELPAILFIHHPPDLVSDGFMALNQPLHNYAQAADAIGRSPIQQVFCGHYHNFAEKECDGFRLHVTSSPAFQIDLDSVEFKMQPFEPAVRVIELQDEGVSTEVIYV
ncbi:MAG: hypothetical protein HKN85_11830 [Gammaproteobacteria bacterium]|nr:hypothetical protein [Gammaproteobacteria bacterium]